MAGNDDEHLAYGDLPGQSQSSTRTSNTGTSPSSASHKFGSFLNKVTGAVQDIKTKFSEELPAKIPGIATVQHRFHSFAGPRDGNDVKWYVDGCGYFWAVSVALEQARESVWILDWWLSPELYLRRPPASNEQYRLDRMLQAAAERGVKVNIIVYKEVTSVLTRTFLKPMLSDYLVSLLPKEHGPMNLLSELGIRLTFSSLEHLEKENPLIEPPITVDSEHTKHELEALHPNIAVFRHPDHAPDKQVLESEFLAKFRNLKLSAGAIARLPVDAVEALYGLTEDTILYWAHHEKLCIVDSDIAFMGGLDLCFGRWDANQHSIADAHPGDLRGIVWPGQDYNNCRLMDFADVSKWENNKLDRKESSRAGWSDVSIGIRGPVLQDLREHFVQRWNFIHGTKYDVRQSSRYHPLSVEPEIESKLEQLSEEETAHKHHNFMKRFEHKGEEFSAQLQHRVHEAEQQYLGIHHQPAPKPEGPRICQLMRSASKWSHGVHTEHSIANAYISLIRQSNHFIYIENQFFITATGKQQSPIKNTIGAAIVERIIRAAESKQNFRIIVVIPAIPGFAGDLKEESSIGTRAIMDYQYKSISRGEHSIFGQIIKAGYEPRDYITFYNLRNYDRINTSSVMKDAEAQSGVDYEAARREFDDQMGGYQGGAEERIYGKPVEEDLNKYQQAAQGIDDRNGLGNTRWDSVAECYMLDGPDLRDVPWEDGDLEEIDAFVSEELYVHTKVMIVDDRVVVCGSANLNDRSQLGYHDSEIAMVIEDNEHVDSYMDGRKYRASKFATSLRRQLMRKHLGLIRPQVINRPDQNFMPPRTANEYDFGSPEDQLVMDPLASNCLTFWQNRAKVNTDAFAKVFHSIPDDRVRNWKDYQEFYEKYFHDAAEVADGKKPSTDAKIQWGHVVKQDFPSGVDGAKQVKEILSTIKGTLVEMPLWFLCDEDIAKHGLQLNTFTEDVYT